MKELTYRYIELVGVFVLIDKQKSYGKYTSI